MDEKAALAMQGMKVVQVMDAPAFPINFPGQLAEMPEDGYGLCDSEFSGIRQSAEAFRYTTIYVPLTVDGLNLERAADKHTGFFDAGVGDEVTGFGQLTNADTDLNKGGSLARNQENFTIRSFGVQVCAPFILSAEEKQYPAWLVAYQKRIQQAFLDNHGLSYSYADGDTTGDLGMMKYYPQHSAVKSSDNAVNGDPIGPAVLMPLRRPLVTGGRDDSDKLSVTLDSGNAFRIDGDPLQPIPAGVTTVYVPVNLIAYGPPGKKQKCSPACITPDGRILVVPIGPYGQLAAQLG